MAFSMARDGQWKERLCRGLAAQGRPQQNSCKGGPPRTGGTAGKDYLPTDLNFTSAESEHRKQDQEQSLGIPEGGMAAEPQGNKSRAGRPEYAVLGNGRSVPLLVPSQQDSGGQQHMWESFQPSWGVHQPGLHITRKQAIIHPTLIGHLRATFLLNHISTTQCHWFTEFLNTSK